MSSPSTGEEPRSSVIMARVTSGRSWSMAASTLAMRAEVSRRAAALLCSTRRSDSCWMVRTVEAPKPKIRTTMMTAAIFAVSRKRITRGYPSTFA